ncbi:MAG: thiaminase II [Planctomycetes bacterium RBG_16_64_10]|nr:MAG: thiaminase II [Planctomycetes bacterium RBG_16_64_10]
MLHESLWRENADVIRSCLEHPFVRGLADGTLSHDAFRYYVAQDALFLRAFVRAYALAAAKCADLDHARLFHELMTGALNELKLHAGYAAQLGIHLTHVKPDPATSAYTEFLLRVAWHDSLAEIIAAMLPCMQLYWYLGTELAASLYPQHPFEDWIGTYSSKEFKQLCTRLEWLLDEVASDCPAVRDAYCYAMKCELGFFSAPMENPP